MTTLAIDKQEFADRRERAVRLAAERGLSGLLVWSRNATTVDWYGDVMYLANHHTPFPQQADNPPLWSGRGHSVLVLPVEGEPVLVVDSAEYRRDLIAVSDVRVGINLPALVAEAVEGCGLASAPLGLVGRESLLLSSYRLLCHALDSQPDLTPSDDLLEDLRMIKSPAELELMRAAAEIGAECMTAMINDVEAGKTEGDLAAAGLGVAARRGAFPYDIAITSGPRSALFQWARMPSWDHKRPLADGDLVHIDLYGPAAEGYWTDFVRSAVVGRAPTKPQAALLDGAIDHVQTMIAAIRPGVTFGEVWAIGDRWRRENGFGDDNQGLGAMFPAFGHCIGLGGGEPPYLTANSTAVVANNMVIAVETLLTRAGVGGAGFEQDIVVRSSGCEVLTERCPAKTWK